MWKVLHSITSNDLNIESVHRPRLGHPAKVPVRNRSSSAFHLSAYEHSFAVMGPELWNCIPHVLNTIQDFPSFKRKLKVFILSVPDTPPARGYTPAISNSLLCWRKDMKHLLHGVITPDGFIVDQRNAT